MINIAFAFLFFAPIKSPIFNTAKDKIVRRPNKRGRNYLCCVGVAIPLGARNYNPRFYLYNYHNESIKTDNMKEKEFHIGKLIKIKLQEEERSEAWLARKVHCNPGNFNRILKNKSIDMDLLKRISVVMNFNFCQVYSEYVQKSIDFGKETE